MDMSASPVEKVCERTAGGSQRPVWGSEESYGHAPLMGLGPPTDRCRPCLVPKRNSRGYTGFLSPPSGLTVLPSSSPTARSSLSSLSSPMPYFSLRRDVHSLPSSAPNTDPEKTISPPPAAARDVLPPPVTQASLTPEKKGKQKKSARVERNLRAHWDRFKRRLGTGTAPSTSSALEPDESGDGSSYPRSRADRAAQMDEVPDEAVDEVVVDREWSDEIKSSSITHSEHGGTPDKGSNAFGTGTDRESFAIQASGFWGLCMPLVILRWRAWPLMYSFFCTRFLDEKSEAHYNKENWFLRKNLGLWSAAFFVANWTLGVAFIAQPLVLADRIYYYGVSVALTFPLVPMIMYDWPRDRVWSYQTYLVFAIWIWPTYQLLFM